MMRVFLAACAAVALCGCATTFSPEVVSRLDQIAATATPRAVSSGAFAVTDERDPDARRTRRVPLGIAGGFSCNLGVDQMGDDNFASDRIARLENALTTAFPNLPANTPLVVRRYDIYLNHSAETNSQAVGAAFSGGLLAAAIAPMPDGSAAQVARRPRCERERMLGGWFDPSDLTNNAPPMTVEIDVNIFGQDVAVTQAISPDVDFFQLGLISEQAPSLQRAAEATAQRAMERASARLIERIRPPQTEAAQMVQPVEALEPTTP